MSKDNQSDLQVVFGNMASVIAGNVAEAFSQIDWSPVLPRIAPQIILPPIDFGDLDQHLREEIILLAKGGWYPNGEMTLGIVHRVAEEISKGSYENADRSMIATFEENYLVIQYLRQLWASGRG